MRTNEIDAWRCDTCNRLNPITTVKCTFCADTGKLRDLVPSYYSPERYGKLVSLVLVRITELSRLKGGEYAGDDDRLANFRRNAQALGTSMELVWAVYAGKHWDAIMQYVKDQATGKDRPRAEPLQGRLDDLIVYAILMKAILDEKGGENELKL